MPPNIQQPFFHSLAETKDPIFSEDLLYHKCGNGER